MDESRTPDAAAPGGESAIPLLPLALNAIYRRWLLVAAVTALGLLAGVLYGVLTTPLYRATAIVRPGIMSYGTQGAPVREWRHKDVLNWFGRQMYWDDLREDPAFSDLHHPPVILAEHIPAGGLYQEGGDVIVLEHLATDGARAAFILNRAIDSFNEQATADSSGTLQLTRVGLQLQIAEYEVEMATLEVEQAKIEQQVFGQRQKLRRLAGRMDQAGVDAAMETGRQRSHARALAAADSTLAAGRDQLAAVQGALGRLVSQGAAGESGEFARAVAAMQAESHLVQVRADTLRRALSDAELLARRHQLEKDEVLGADHDALEAEVAILELQREKEIPLKIAGLRHRIRSERQRLALLTPLERIGETRKTLRPVRPRRLRAMVILGGLALISGLGLALTVDYMARHRGVIFSRSGV